VGRLGGHKPDAVIAAFRRFGWEIRRQTGGHVIMRKEGNPNVLSIPYHKGRDLKEGLLRSQLQAAGIDVDSFLAVV